jgi:plastocyanin
MHRLSMCHLLTVVLLSADVFFAPSASAQNGQTQSSAVPLNSSQPGPASSATEDAAAKAAERKKRFEEAKKRLENSAPQPQSGTASSSSSCSYSQSDLSLSPALVNMVVGNTQRFSLFDLAGHKLTAQADWSVSDSSIAEIRVEGGEPVLTSKEKGTVRVQARVDSHSAESTVNVIAPEDMKPGTIRWSTPSSPCSKTTKIIPAVPH